MLQSRAGCWEALEAEVGRAAAGAWAFRTALLGQPEATHRPPLTAPHSRPPTHGSRWTEEVSEEPTGRAASQTGLWESQGLGF